MNEQRRIIVRGYKWIGRSVIEGPVFAPPYKKVIFKLQDGNDVYAKEFDRIPLIGEIARLEQAGEMVPDEYRDAVNSLV